MKKNLLWIVAVVFSLALGQSALAKSCHCGKGMKKMVEQLNLSEEQKAKVMPILDKLKSSMQANRGQMKDFHAQLNQLVQSDKMDQSAVDSLIDKKTKMMGDRMKARVDAKHQIYILLNEQQKASYQAMVKKWQDKMDSKAEGCMAKE